MTDTDLSTTTACKRPAYNAPAHQEIDRKQSGHKKHGRKKSAARMLLDPNDILAHAPRTTLEESWAWFSDRLARAGFESCGFMISPRDSESPLNNPESKLYGEVVSKDYLKFAQENPAMQTQARPYRRLRTSRAPITYLCEEDLLRDASPSERKLAESVNSDFGIRGWALYPVHSPEKNQTCSFGWWDLTNQDDARKLWAAEASTFTLAATYFTESIAPLINRETSDASAALSQREIECLLWAGAGKTTAEIAAVLNVADGTVEEYFKRAAKKLGATTRAQACVRAVISGIITP